MSVVIGDSHVCLNFECGVRSSSFFKHTLFRRVSPLLLDASTTNSVGGSGSGMGSGAGNSTTERSTTTSERRYHILHLLMVLVTHSPRTVVQSTLPSLLPVVVLSLTSKSSMLRETSLPAVAMVLRNDVDSFASHAESCCDSLLRMCGVEGQATTCVSALKCLSLMRGLSPDVVVRLREKIVSGLWSTLDHPSKSVRRAAVVCRNQWYVV